MFKSHQSCEILSLDQLIPSDTVGSDMGPMERLETYGRVLSPFTDVSLRVLLSILDKH